MELSSTVVVRKSVDLRDEKWSTPVAPEEVSKKDIN